MNLSLLSKDKIPDKLFITGTNTDIGKTVVSAILMAGLEGYYWKPVQTGIIESSDTQWVKETTMLPESHFFPETYCLQQPLSPHAAAALEGVAIELADFKLPRPPEERTLIVEGAGGILVPLNDRHYMLDLMKMLNIPVLLVADSALGTINHTLLSLDKMRQYDLEIWGVVMNGPKNEGNRQAIESYGEIPVRAEIEPLSGLNLQILSACFQRCFADVTP